MQDYGKCILAKIKNRTIPFKNIALDTCILLCQININIITFSLLYQRSDLTIYI